MRRHIQGERPYVGSTPYLPQPPNDDLILPISADHHQQFSNVPYHVYDPGGYSPYSYVTPALSSCPSSPIVNQTVHPTPQYKNDFHPQQYDNSNYQPQYLLPIQQSLPCGYNTFILSTQYQPVFQHFPSFQPPPSSFYNYYPSEILHYSSSVNSQNHMSQSPEQTTDPGNRFIVNLISYQDYVHDQHRVISSVPNNSNNSLLDQKPPLIHIEEEVSSYGNSVNEHQESPNIFYSMAQNDGPEITPIEAMLPSQLIESDDHEDFNVTQLRMYENLKKTERNDNKTKSAINSEQNESPEDLDCILQRALSFGSSKAKAMLDANSQGSSLTRHESQYENPELNSLLTELYWCGNPSVELIDGLIYFYSALETSQYLKELQQHYQKNTEQFIPKNRKIVTRNEDQNSTIHSQKQKNDGESVRLFSSLQLSEPTIDGKTILPGVKSHMDNELVISPGIVVLIVPNVPANVAPAELVGFINRNCSGFGSKHLDLVKVLQGASPDSYPCLLFCHVYSVFDLFIQVSGRPYNPLEAAECSLFLVKGLTASVSGNRLSGDRPTARHKKSSERNMQFKHNHQLNLKRPTKNNDIKEYPVLPNGQKQNHIDSRSSNNTIDYSIPNQSEFSNDVTKFRLNTETLQQFDSVISRLMNVKYALSLASSTTSQSSPSPNINLFFHECTCNSSDDGISNLDECECPCHQQEHHLPELSFHSAQSDPGDTETSNRRRSLLGTNSPTSTIHDNSFPFDNPSFDITPSPISPLPHNDLMNSSSLNRQESLDVSLHNDFKIHESVDDSIIADKSRTSGKLPVTPRDFHLNRFCQLKNKSPISVLAGRSRSISTVSAPQTHDTAFGGTDLPIERLMSIYSKSNEKSIKESKPNLLCPTFLVRRYECPEFCAVCLEKVICLSGTVTLGNADSLTSKNPASLISKRSSSPSLTPKLLPSIPVNSITDDSMLDLGVSINILCGHAFHSDCLLRWGDVTCPVCRHHQYPNKTSSCCDICGVTDHIRLCLVCGFLGCTGEMSPGHRQGTYLPLGKSLTKIYEKYFIPSFVYISGNQISKQPPYNRQFSGLPQLHSTVLPSGGHSHQHFIDSRHVYALEVFVTIHTLSLIGIPSFSYQHKEFGTSHVVHMFTVSFKIAMMAKL